MPDEVPEDVVLSCGCLIRCEVVDGVNTLKFFACREGCDNVRLILEEADAQGKPAEVRRA